MTAEVRSAPSQGHSGAVMVAYAAVSLVWGSTFLGIRLALESFPPFFIGALRFFVAGAALFVFARARGEPAPTGREWWAALLAGVLFFVVGNGFVNVSEQSVSSGLVSVLVATMPLWGTVFARLFGERVGRAEVAGVVLGLVGVAILNFGGELRASPTGAALALLAPMGWALGSIVTRRLPAPPGMMRTAVPMLTGGGLMWLVGLATHERFNGTATARSIAAVVYLCLFGSILGFSAFSYLLKHTRPALAMSYAYINPVIAVLLGVTFGGERFGATSFLGTSVVLVAVVVVARARS
jgi:drug/metabolite transporter (DMT)-like permease